MLRLFELPPERLQEVLAVRGQLLAEGRECVDIAIEQPIAETVELARIDGQQRERGIESPASFLGRAAEVGFHFLAKQVIGPPAIYRQLVNHARHLHDVGPGQGFDQFTGVRRPQR